MNMKSSDVEAEAEAPEAEAPEAEAPEAESPRVEAEAEEEVEVLETLALPHHWT